MSLSPAQVRTLVEAKVKGAHQLAELKKNYHRTLITILLISSFTNTAASALMTVIMTDAFGSAGLGIATGIVTALVLIFGDITPKSLASSHAKLLAPIFAPPLYVMGVILAPLIYVLDILIALVHRLLGTKKHAEVTDEELLAMASIGAEEGSIDKQELELIENALEFNDIQVGDIMTPRVHMDALHEDQDLQTATEFVMNHTHTRIPVYRETIDNIVGILSIKTLLKAHHEEEDPDEVTLRQIELLKPVKVPDNMHVSELFREFKRKRQHMAIVLDEHGGTAGLVTMEDLLEELVGDIEDEQDLAEENIKKLSEGLYELSGRVELDDLAELTGLEFDHPEYKTVSFLIVDALGYLPREGQSIAIENWQFTVKHMLRNTILKVELRRLSPNVESPPASQSK